MIPDMSAPKRCPRDAAIRLATPDADNHDHFSRVALSLFRFIGAAYVTGDSSCWEAAHHFAETADMRDSALLVARVATLVRIFRCGGACDLTYLPPCCNRLSKDERQLMRLLAAARDGASAELATIASMLVDAAREATTIQAVNELAGLASARSLPHAVKLAG